MAEFVTFKISKKLKEKWFREKCMWHYYDDTKDIYKSSLPQCYNYGGNASDAPTISQVLKWLRNEKKLYIEPCILVDADTDADGRVINEYIYWSFSITSIETGDMIYFEYEHIDDRRFNSYEEAVLVGIEHCLDNLI